jgi:hypothetical protein
MREAILLSGARATYDVMGDAERRDVDHRLGLIERDQAPAAVTAFDDPAAPRVSIFDDGTWRIVYTVPDQATVLILGIRHALDLLD